MKPLSREDAEAFRKWLSGISVYLANHGFTQPVSEVVRGMEGIEALASGEHVVVPAEPSNRMIDAGLSVQRWYDSVPETYLAMIRAAQGET